MDQQLANAARLAGLVPPGSTAQARVQRIAGDVAPVIAAAVAREMDNVRQHLAERDREESEMLKACRSVGAAFDRLEQARYTPGEIKARMALEQSARALRRLINKKDAHATR